MNVALDAKRENPAIRIRAVSPIDFGSLLPALVDLLRDTVNTGASLGFLAPLDRAEAQDYWLSLAREIHDGCRLLFAAYNEDRIVGTGQLALPTFPNARHRAELQKLFVNSTMRGRGVGRSLIAALHDAALRRGRSLLILNARRGGPSERLYKTLGYRVAGVIPGYTRGAAGETYDHVTLYQEFSIWPRAA